METYHKISTPFKRHFDGPDKGKLIVGDWAVEEFAYLANNEWEFTEKVDGTNIRIEYVPGYDLEDHPSWDERQHSKVNFAGRTDNAVVPKPLLEYLQDTFTSLLFYKHGLVDTQLTLFGEGYGPKIQGGGKYRSDHSFVLFDVKIGDWWLKRDDVNDIAAKLGIDSVPVIGRGTLFDAIDSVSSETAEVYTDGSNLVANATVDGLKSQWGDFKAEGIVAVPSVPLFTRRGDRIITKIKAVDFR